MPSLNTRSTGNRRAVRNALFRSMMDRPKLRESDLRPSRTILGPSRADDFTADGINAFGIGYGLRPSEPPRYADPTCDLGPPPPAPWDVPPPPPHPLLRWWRRLLWGE